MMPAETPRVAPVREFKWLHAADILAASRRGGCFAWGMRWDVRRCCRALPAWLAVWLRRSCKDPPSAPREAGRGLVLALRPSPLARRLGRAFTAAQLLYAAELALLGHGRVAVLVACLPVALHLHGRMRRRSSWREPGRLVLTARGRLHLFAGTGAVEEVRLASCSLGLGPWLLLCLDGTSGRYRLLLGPDNLDPTRLAALRRRLVLVDQGAQAVAPGLPELLAAGPAAGEGTSGRRAGPTALCSAESASAPLR